MLTLGIDEVGRGAWAGPLVVGAVVFSQGRVPSGLADSKKLSKKQRASLSQEIKKSAVAIGLGWVDAAILDKIGLSRALSLAAERAVAQIPPAVRADLDQVIIDGYVNFLAKADAVAQAKISVLPKADTKIAAVSAAAIIAKVFRDNYMTRLEKVFPEHKFARHVGYGTSLHQEKLREFGALDGVHRRSFAPVAALSKSVVVERTGRIIKSSVSEETCDDRLDERRGKFGRLSVEQTAGRIAENIATAHLEKLGHRIITQNWKTKFCEIDIVSTRDETLFFTEVKFRGNARHGDGLVAITPRKLKQIQFATEIFLQKYHAFTKNYDVQIAAISLSKDPPRVDEFIEDIS